MLLSTVCIIDFLRLYLFWTEKKCFLIETSLNTNFLTVHRHNIEPMKFIVLVFVCSSVVLYMCYLKNIFLNQSWDVIINYSKERSQFNYILCFCFFFTKKELHNFYIVSRYIETRVNNVHVHPPKNSIESYCIDIYT